MNAFYPSDQQHLFTNRLKELAELEHYQEKLYTAPAEHLALFGLCRIGKTLLLKEFLRRVLVSRSDVIPVYMDFSALCSSPENFASGFVGSLCYWLVNTPSTVSTVAMAERGDSSGRLAYPKRKTYL